MSTFQVTMSTLTSYRSLDVNQVRIHAEPTQDTHAATRLYVDTAAAAVRNSIVDGAGPALDTLKEIEVFLQGDGSNMSGSLIHTMTQLQGQVTAEGGVIVLRGLSMEPNLADIHASITGESTYCCHLLFFFKYKKSLFK